MKLVNKTSLYYLLYAIPVMVLCAILCYYLIHKEVVNEIDDNIRKDKIKIEGKLQKGLPASEFNDDNIQLIPFTGNSFPYTYWFTDTAMYDKIEQEVIPFRIMTSFADDGK